MIRDGKRTRGRGKVFYRQRKENATGGKEEEGGEDNRVGRRKREGVLGLDIIVSFEPSDGTPPNGLSLVGSGESFPVTGVSDGDFFLRTDFSPHRLFQKSGNRWVKYTDDGSRTWAAANKALTSFINNDNYSINTEGEVTEEKQNISKVVKPRTD